MIIKYDELLRDPAIAYDYVHRVRRVRGIIRSKLSEKEGAGTAGRKRD